jgi:hypothetical protein
VLLEDILKEQLQQINDIQYKGQTYDFSEANIQSGINALKDVPLQEGLIAANENIYNLLTLGKALEQTIEGIKRVIRCNTLTGRTRPTMLSMLPKNSVSCGRVVMSITARISCCL